MRSWRVLLLFPLGFAVSACGPQAASEPIDPIEYQWGEEPIEGAWKQAHPFDEIARESKDPRAALWIRVEVPASVDIDPALSLRAMIGTGFEQMRIEGSVIPITGSTPILPLSRAGVPVLLRARPQVSAIAPSVMLGSQRAIWISSVRREMPEILAGGALLLAGALLLLSALRRGSAKAYRGLGAFLAAMGVMSFEPLPITRSLVSPSPLVTYYVYEAAGYLLPFFYGSFVVAILGDTKRRLLGRGARVYAVIAGLAVALGLAFGRAESLDEIRAVANTFILFQSVVVLVLATRRARTGDRAAKAFLYGFALLILISMPDILDGMGLFTLQIQTIPYAALAFGAVMIIVTERKVVETRDALETSAGELSRKLAALEEKNREVLGLNVELRHQIAERSRDLSTALRVGPPAHRSAKPLREGDSVGGRYRVIRQLGEGGMGAVHEVERTSDGRRFALKVLSGAPHPTAAARFAREAEIAARVVDPHLVSVVDVSGRASDDLYLVMELVHGRSLEEARARFGDVAWGMRVLTQIAKGLAALHAAGVVHRDLKPGNVLLARSEEGAEIARISDFGISRFGPGDDSIDAGEDPTFAPAGTEAAPEPDTVDSPSALWASEPGARIEPDPAPINSPHSIPLTATGIVMGTPAYMAPELRKGARRAKPASDVFAFGLLGHEVLTGRPAFRAPPIQLALTNKHLPQITRLPDSVPPPVAALIVRCLDEEPYRRPTITEALSVLCAEAER